MLKCVLISVTENAKVRNDISIKYVNIVMPLSSDYDKRLTIERLRV